MQNNEQHSPDQLRVLAFAGAFAAALILTRLLVRSWAHADISGLYLIGLLFSFCLAGVYGGFLGLLLARYRGRVVVTALLWVVLTVVVAINVICFHYEAVFGRLPGVQLLFYWDQMEQLSSSLRSNLPLGRVSVEIVIVITALATIWRKLPDLQRAEGANYLIWLPALCFLIAIGVNAVPSVLPASMQWASRDPLIWLAQSAFIKGSYDLRKLSLSEHDFDRFLVLHGQADPGPVLDRDFPLCRSRPAPEFAATGQSVIVLILESVGYREMVGEFNGQPIMPNLRRIATENVSFERAVSPSTKSIQTLTAMFSGLPPQPFNFYLWQTPLLNFDGLPRQLQAIGYDAAYFHGGDLSFERQRQYLRAAGFAELHEYDQKRSLPIYGWGYDDATMFGELRRWIEGRKVGAAPYLVTLFTLSSHDPYILPVGWTPVFSSQARHLLDPEQCCAVTGDADATTAAMESFRFLDTQLGEFYSWYTKLSDPPLLVIVGDHAPHLINDDAVTVGQTMRFDVPLIFAGLRQEPAPELVRAMRRPVAIHDVPVTLSHLLGMRVHPCMIGGNLFDPDHVLTPVYAVGPESMQQVHVWDGDAEVLFERASERYSMLRSAQAHEESQVLNSVRAFVEATFPIHYYLLEKNAYFPPIRAGSARPALLSVTKPLFAAHRGNTRGPQAADQENSRAALEQAAASSFPWLEVDVQINADGIPVLIHDDTIVVDGQASAVVDLTLQQLRVLPGREEILTLEQLLSEFLPRKKLLIEVKPQLRYQTSAQLSRATVALLNRHPTRGRVIIDSFDEFLATSIKQQCDCEVGLDTPFQRPLTAVDLDHYHQLGVDWLYVEESVVTADLIRNAHSRGLKVMAYTVNDPATIKRWQSQGELPDGIITDHESISRGN